MKVKWIGAVAILALTTLFAACNNDDDTTPTPTDQIVNLSATINGAQEKPTSTTSTATGSMTGTMNTTTNVLSYTVTYQGMTPTMGHIHQITMADSTGPAVIPFASLTSPISGTASVTAARRDSILAGQFYVNLHSAAYPNGEIRGNIRRQ